MMLDNNSLVTQKEEKCYSDMHLQVRKALIGWEIVLFFKQKQKDAYSMCGFSMNENGGKGEHPQCFSDITSSAHFGK